MRKKVIVGLVMISFLSMVKMAKAFNGDLFPSLGPYMTDEGPFVENPQEKNVFGWDEKPYAFIQFAIDNLNKEYPIEMVWAWYSGEMWEWVSWEYEVITNFPEEGKLNLWNSLDNWEIHKKIGEWIMEVNWWNGEKREGGISLGFTVTPEPVSSVLFLLGFFSLFGVKNFRGKNFG